MQHQMARVSPSLYRVTFLNQGKVYEVYVRRVHQNGLWGFVVLEDFVFGNRSTVVVDPSEEKLRDEFGGTRSVQVPMHAVLRIDEVNREGTAKITPAEGGNVMPFPFPTCSSGQKEPKS